ncbi:uncharacterized protein CIMG_02125 [Coccidioides immitis RS]|uniref:HNH nuclease domain-containing protein n=5 Tax=Coccidioides TaxID=5500 RepID=J3KKQ2_COCIM|nr:uncharacterized protein CIMG_02125 [Coccidioides immitis RS]XP_003065250.1 hypothetical protein CPC735_044750 [Coccidioides posadasii C735 delta SOWgp]EFW13313.1 conserved hypothetical protein [Coccidioides posadasii str. Silveira]KMM64361.1 hypothetical protein CPAG_00713 [Coccidioides posadasii RMSCC 3488]KMP02124.1 hypothetical protein CIRG_02263 [Coccidioides immitis RMSCC 2394]TPX25148.1 hypothetical protein DIZ76_010597 [Coccidioides immitis]EAS36771.3 hypothetical protein CIMG_02125|eukprot:XP_003065250.1 hypothetical protein CPC735_044750 [Coccidioides posadasii C735 delta SOWgp]
MAQGQKRKHASDSPPVRRTRRQTLMQVDEASAAVPDTTHSCFDNPMLPSEESSLPSEEHLNIPTQERKELLVELANALETDKVRAAFWACLQVCDIDQLRELIRQAKAAPQLMSLLARDCHSLPRLWKQLVTRSNSSTTTSPKEKSIKSRASGPKEQACERDNSSCVFTKSPIFEVAHIYPHCLIRPATPPNERTDEIQGFWKILEFFWKPEKIQQWRQEIFCCPNNPNDGSDACFNLICMQPTIHTAWTKGLFALRPLEYNEDKSKLDVEWYWQPKQSHGPYDLVDLRKPPSSSRDLDEVDGCTVALESSPNNFARLKSGHRFTLGTPDAQRLPLPSRALLELQWNLNRIVSMSAAGEDDDDDERRSYTEKWVNQLQEHVICSEPGLSASTYYPPLPSYLHA